MITIPSGSRSRLVIQSGALAGLVLLVLRLGTFDLVPTWDGAMSVWPAAIETARDWNIGRVLSLPSYTEGGPNTHTLSLFTLGAAALVTLFGPENSYLLVQLASVAMAVTLGVLISLIAADLGHRRFAIWVSVAFVTYPMVAGQSAYLYTEIPSALLAFASLAIAYSRKPALAIVLMSLAVWVKALAVVAIPALALMIWRKQGSARAGLAACLAIVALAPTLWAPRAGIEQDLFARTIGSLRVSFAYLVRSPELIAVLFVPAFVALAMRRTQATDDEKTWLHVVLLLNSAFVASFFLNPIITAGHFFLPRYATLLLPGTFVLVTIWLSRIKRVSSGLLMIIAVLGFAATARGPMALGSHTALHPVAERSMAYIDLLDDHRVALHRLHQLSDAMPVFFDHYAQFGFEYPRLDHFGDGAPANGETTYPKSSLDRGLAAQPGKFALMYSVPILGGERMESIRRDAWTRPNYRVSEEVIGSTEEFPLRIVIVERTSG